MYTLTASVPVPNHQQPASYDEMSMQETILVDDSVKVTVAKKLLICY